MFVITTLQIDEPAGPPGHVKTPGRRLTRKEIH
jgi:hypothetical protein